MAGEFSPIAKDVACKINICKIDLFHIKANLITNYFSKFLVKFLRKSIKYIVSRLVLGALSGVLKVAHLRVMTIQAHSKMFPENEGKNEFSALKLIV